MKHAAAALLLASALAACGGSSSSSSSSSAATWKDLRSVRVTVAQPGLPPPFGRPRTTSFTTPAQVARVTTLLNAHHIARAAAAAANPGCAGGFQIQLEIVPSAAAPVKLSAYRCANKTSGDVGGDLPGFLKAIGINT